MNAIADCEQHSYADGLAAGLQLALTGVDLDTAPGPVAAVPADRVPTGAHVIEHSMAAGTGISFLRLAERAAGGQPAGFSARLGATRLGATRRLLDWATAHLSARTAGGEPIIRKQLVLGVLADSHTELEAARHCLLVAGDIPAAVTDVHDRITVLDWEITKLLGASGYAGESPARGAYVSRLIANCWIAREAS